MYNFRHNSYREEGTGSEWAAGATGLKMSQWDNAGNKGEEGYSAGYMDVH